MKYIFKLVSQKDTYDQFEVFVIDKEIDCPNCVDQEQKINKNSENIEYKKNLINIINNNFNNLNISSKPVLTFMGELFEIKEICSAANKIYKQKLEEKANNTYIERKPFSIETKKIGIFAQFKIGKNLFIVNDADKNSIFESLNYSDANKVCNFLNKVWIS